MESLAKIEHIMKLGAHAFDTRSSLMSFWQEVAEQFYPERADFTTTRYLGSEFGTDLMTSHPVRVRRDLGDSISSILRPRSVPWFHTRTEYDWDEVSTEGRTWLEKAEKVQRRAMYTKDSQFTRATKEADHDFITFGQAVIQPTYNSKATGMLYRCHHLRDVAWMENVNGVIDTVFRKWAAPVRVVAEMFPGKMHDNMCKKVMDDPYGIVNLWHVSMPYTSCMPQEGMQRKQRLEYMSFYIDVDNKHILEEVPAFDLGYIIPRWKTVSGFQYAISPATCIGILDARMLQSMAYSLIEAAEKAVTPPMVASKQAFGGNFSVYASGITWADFPDGRISDTFATIPLDKNGIPFGREMLIDLQNQLNDAFYINKLTLPEAGINMTAYEVGQRVQEHIRQVMPLFEPIENEYNAPLCDMTFGMLMRKGAFGPVENMPPELYGMDIAFTFESPLHEGLERAKVQKFAEAQAIVTGAAAIDPEAAVLLDIMRGTRDTLQSSGAPSDWIRSKSAVNKIVADAKAKAEAAEQAAAMQVEADTLKTAAETAAVEDEL